MDTGTLLWTPRPERVKQSQMYAFMDAAARRHRLTPEWPALHRWSVQRRDCFWPEMLEFAGIEPNTPAEAPYRGEGMLQTRWFPGMTLNYAAHLLRHDGERVAIIAEDECGRRRTLTRRELRDAVARCAAALRAAGVQRGDRVAGFVPNVPEAVIAMLATASLGAVWSSCSPDFGIKGIFDRFGQIAPKVLLVADGYTYNGKTFDSLERAAAIVEQIPAIQRTVVIGFAADEPAMGPLAQAARGGAALSWNAFLEQAGPAPLQFEPVPFDHPLFIMYSSGTTGMPKCIVHGHGGTLLQHMKELMLHCDLRSEDRIFYFTTCGWMMWNWVVSSLGVGATLVLYEGSPSHPDLHTLWDMADRQRITVFGTSPKFLAACGSAGLHPGRSHDLSRLRCLLSTGAPLSAEQFEYAYRHIQGDLQLSSISGGTDIISCFMLGNPLLPVRAGEIQCLGLGMDVQAFDDIGRPVVGRKGELVCCTPFPCQPVGFWNDADGERYRRAYFDHFPGVWRHGDYIEITPHGGVIVYGRSDATLNPGGVRIGTAEIYRVVEGMDEIQDSIVVGKPVEGDVEVCLFVVLKPGLTLDAELTARIARRIAEATTRRHVPKHIRQVPAVPYTISGKKVELAVVQVLCGEAVQNKDALANPQALDHFRGVV